MVTKIWKTVKRRYHKLDPAYKFSVNVLLMVAVFHQLLWLREWSHGNGLVLPWLMGNLLLVGFVNLFVMADNARRRGLRMGYCRGMIHTQNFMIRRFSGRMSERRNRFEQFAKEKDEKHAREELFEIMRAFPPELRPQCPAYKFGQSLADHFAVIVESLKKRGADVGDAFPGMDSDLDSDSNSGSVDDS